MIWLLACTDPAPPLDRAAMLDPESCEECHPSHVEEWRSSMHAYAAADPVFLAMNARGQRETDGALGNLCINCHAPMAVREGATEDGLNLDEVDPALLGVTCYTCHAATGVHEDFNNAIDYTDDLVMRGGIDDPVENTAHASARGELQDRASIESSSMCGTCHDVVTPVGLHLERTYAEWKTTQYSQPVDGLQQTCGNCHMDGVDGLAADYEGSPERRVHSHRFPGVDTALTDFPGAAELEADVQKHLDPVVLPSLSVCEAGDGVQIKLVLDNVAAGHGWPSGAAQDRRGWAQVTAWVGDEQVFQTGVVPEGTAVHDVEDPDRPTFGDLLYNAEDERVHMFWEATRYESSQLIGLTPDTDIHARFSWNVGAVYPTKVEVRVFLRAIDVDVLQSLVDSGDLDPAFLTAVPTRELANGYLVWESLVEPCGA